MTDAIVPSPVPGPTGPHTTIGDITVAGDQIITPIGSFPLRGATWTVNDMTRIEQKIPTHAIVLAIIFALFCLIGLLFLLMKEEQVTGHMQVTTANDGKAYQTLIPVSGRHTVMWVHQQVNYLRAQSMSM